jgi:hypothetical protein
MAGNRLAFVLLRTHYAKGFSREFQMFSRCALVVLLIACLFCLSGCIALGYVASAIPQSTDAQYTGLAGQRTAVLVWAPRGVRVDHPNLQLDLANAIQANLAAKINESSLKGTEFPYETRSVLRFQREHPELEFQSVTEWSHRMSGLDRLVYVEVIDFSTRSGTAVQLLRGGISANVKVVEMHSGSSKIAYERPDVRLFFPRNAPEGVVNVSDAAIYTGTINEMGLTIARLFFPHIIEN